MKQRFFFNQQNIKSHIWIEDVNKDSEVSVVLMLLQLLHHSNSKYFILITFGNYCLFNIHLC